MTNTSISFAISIIALLTSLVAMTIAGFTAYTLPINSDNASFALGTLSSLVALLVGWQIYSTIDIKEQIRKTTELTKEFEELKRKTAIESNSALFVSLSQLGRFAYNKVNAKDDSATMARAEAIMSLLNALCLWEKEMNTPLAKEAYEYCTIKLSELIKDVTLVVESIEEKDAFVLAAMKTGIRELIDFTTKIEVRKE